MLKKITTLVLSLIMVFCTVTVFPVTPNAAASEENSADANEYTVLTDSHNGLVFRAEPSRSGYLLEVIPDGTQLCITEISNGFGKTVYNEKDGWVSMAYLYLPGDESGSDTNTIPHDGTKYYFLSELYDFGALSLHSDASNDSAVIAYVPAYITFYITEISNGFGKTFLKGHEGWLSLDYLRQLPDDFEGDTDYDFDCSVSDGNNSKTLKDVCLNEETYAAISSLKENDELELYVYLTCPEAEKIHNSLDSVAEAEYQAKLNELLDMNKDFCEKFINDYSLKSPTLCSFDTMFICKLTLDNINTIIKDNRLEALSVTESSPENDEKNTDALNACFLEYLKENFPGYYGSYTRILAEYKDYCIFYGSGGISSSAEITKVIENYSVFSANIEAPYSLGLYVYNGKSICTLEEAVAQKYFKLSDIAELVNKSSQVPLLTELIKGDVTNDGLINMQDVVHLQQYVADLIYFSEEQVYSADVNGDGNTDMLDVVASQRVIADL